MNNYICFYILTYFFKLGEIEDETVHCNIVQCIDTGLAVGYKTTDLKITRSTIQYDTSQCKARQCNDI